jgi:hypothetical protein
MQTNEPISVRLTGTPKPGTHTIYDADICLNKRLRKNDLVVYMVLCRLAQDRRELTLENVASILSTHTERELKKSIKHLKKIGVEPITYEQACEAWRQELREDRS